MKTLTLRFVFWFDINTVAVSSVCNIIAAMFALKNTRQVNVLLRKVAFILDISNDDFSFLSASFSNFQVDKELSIFDSKNSLHSSKQRRKIVLAVIGAFALLTTLLGGWADFF